MRSLIIVVVHTSPVISLRPSAFESRTTEHSSSYSSAVAGNIFRLTDSHVPWGHAHEEAYWITEGNTTKTETVGTASLSYLEMLVGRTKILASRSRSDPGFKGRIIPKLQTINRILSGTLQVDDAHAGIYNNCGIYGPVFWLQLWGHTRSLGMHVHNFKSFLDKSSKCWFATAYTRKEVDHLPESETAGWVPDVTAQLDEFAQRGITSATILADVSAKVGSNFAWASVSRSNSKEHRDLLSGAVIFGNAVAEEHSIPISPDDVVALSRPDIVFSHAVNFPRLAAVAKNVSYVLMPRHEAGMVSGNDPSELLVISKRSFWEGACNKHTDFAQSSKLESGCGDDAFSNLRLGETGCLQHCGGCGYFGPLFIYAATTMGFHPFFYSTGLKLHIHRINGDFQLGVMRPIEFDGLSQPDDEVVGTVDLTRRATCVVGRVDACTLAHDSDEGVSPGPESDWGATSWSKVDGGERLGYSSGYWRCAQDSDVA